MPKMELLTDNPEEEKRLHRMQTQRLIKQVISYIENHCTEKLTCAQVASAFSYHPNSLNRIMRAEMGRSLHEIITRAKIDAAIRLLTETDVSITDIAYQIGFYDRAHFAKTFREVTGQSPSAFCRKQKSTQQNSIISTKEFLL